MEWIIKTFESAVGGIISLIGNGLMTIGDKGSDRALPDGRLMDGIKTRRRLKGDMADLHSLYTKLRTYESTAEETCHTLCWRVVLSVLDPTPDQLTSPVVQASVKLCQDLLQYEGYFPLPEVDFSRQRSLGGIWNVIKTTRLQLAFYEKTAAREEVEKTLRLFVYNLLQDRLPELPAHIERAEAELEVPLYSLHRSPVEDMDALFNIVFHKPEEESGFLRLGNTLGMNAERVSRSGSQGQSGKPLLLPLALKEKKSPGELVQLYLQDTPFAEFFMMPLPFVIPLQTRFSHTHILGGSGHGKTQLMQNCILRDFQLLQEAKASVIVIDSQGDLFRNIRQLAKVRELGDRIVLIDPTEIQTPPALNLFDFGLERLHTYDRYTQEMLFNGAIEMYEYLFGAVLGAELTAKQGVIFNYLARLLMVVPGATIDTLLDFLQEPESVRPYLPKIDDPISLRFFETVFFHKSFDETRQQILYRIFDVLKIAALARMFRNKRNKVNLFEAMNRGSLILINTAKDLLKQEGCEILGRFFIALITQAAQERASIDADNRMPTFVYIDEAHDYFDKNIETLLEQVRKQKVGLVLAHQYLGQLPQKLCESVKTNTAIKLVGGLSRDDAHELAPNMGTGTEFLLSMRKYEEARKTEFACSVRNLTQRAIILTVPLGTLEQEPKLTRTELEHILAENRKRYCQMDETPEEPPSDESDPETPDLL